MKPEYKAVMTPTGYHVDCFDKPMKYLSREGYSAGADAAIDELVTPSMPYSCFEIVDYPAYDA